MIDRKLTRNAAQCKLCGDLIVSKDQYDYVSCKCGAIAVDGGLQQIKRTGLNENIIEMCEWRNVHVCGND